MQLHELKRVNANRTKKRVGRGGKRGKTSGRGHKGQKARAGGGGRPELRDIIKRLPKRRGYGKNRARTINASLVKAEVVNLGVINTHFGNDDTVTPAALLEKALVHKAKGRVPEVKVLGQGTFDKTCTFEGCSFSDTAREKIKKAGATIKE